MSGVAFPFFIPIFSYMFYNIYPFQTSAGFTQKPKYLLKRNTKK